MSIPRFAIERPVMMSMISAIIILIGGISLSRLPVDLLPDISQPTVNVRVNYTGVGPLEMEELIVRPLEQQLSAVQGLDQMNSTAQEGNASIQLNFTWGTDLNEAMNDIRTRIDRVRGRLPEDADPPVVQKFDSNAAPIMGLAVESADGTMDRVHAARARRERAVAALRARAGCCRRHGGRRPPPADPRRSVAREDHGARPLGRSRRQRPAQREPEHPDRRGLSGRSRAAAPQPGSVPEPRSRSRTRSSSRRTACRCT
ncbi:MAG: efflux RND transporter permease subunit [Vicinamibacterales bacterium]